MSHIQLDYSKLAPFVADHELEYMQTQVTAVDKALREGIVIFLSTLFQNLERRQNQRLLSASLKSY